MPLTRAWLSCLLVASHEAHETVRLWATERSLLISGHALAETYSVLTGLPGDARVGPSGAVMLIDENFAGSLALPPEMASGAHRDLARLGISGGATPTGYVCGADVRWTDAAYAS